MTPEVLHKTAADLHETLVIGEYAVNKLADLEKTASARAEILGQLSGPVAALLVKAGMTDPSFEKEAADAFANDPVRTLKVLNNVLLAVSNVKTASVQAPKPMGKGVTQKTEVQANPADERYFGNLA